ncbi:MAG: hypothetical protein JWP66_696 [Naasia sp.]|nr:hypothetical protein [Naasia sp.]
MDSCSRSRAPWPAARPRTRRRRRRRHVRVGLHVCRPRRHCGDEYGRRHSALGDAGVSPGTVVTGLPRVRRPASCGHPWKPRAAESHFRVRGRQVPCRDRHPGLHRLGWPSAPPGVYHSSASMARNTSLVLRCGPEDTPGADVQRGRCGSGWTGGCWWCDGSLVRGADGIDGAAGLAGADAAAGPAGADGADGIDVVEGPAGADGVDGAVGPAGAGGTAGQDGPAGADGTQGPAGAEGLAGPAGPHRSRRTAGGRRSCGGRRGVGAGGVCRCRWPGRSRRCRWSCRR